MRQAVTLLVGLMMVGCGGDGVTIYAPPELAQASIFIDGKPSGHFQKTQRQYRWLGWKKMKEEVSAPPRSETVVKLPPVAAGVHELRIDKTGYEPIVTTFTYSSGCLEIEIKDAQVKPTESPGPIPTR